MKKWVFLFSLIIGIFFINGCFLNSDVSNVKNGYLNDFKTITVGDAFDNYKYFTDVKWDSFKTDNGTKIVEVKGYLNNDVNNTSAKNDNKTYLLTQFTINQADNTFNISYMGLDYKDKNGKKKDVSFSSKLTNLTLEFIYKNKNFLTNSAWKMMVYLSAALQ